MFRNIATLQDYLEIMFYDEAFTVMISMYCALILSIHLHPSAFVICFVVHASNSEESNMLIMLVFFCWKDVREPDINLVEAELQVSITLLLVLFLILVVTCV